MDVDSAAVCRYLIFRVDCADLLSTTGEGEIWPQITFASSWFGWYALKRSLSLAKLH